MVDNDLMALAWFCRGGKGNPVHQVALIPQRECRDEEGVCASFCVTSEQCAFISLNGKCLLAMAGASAARGVPHDLSSILE